MKRLIKLIVVFIRTQWRNLGVFLFGNFFSKLYHAKVARRNALRLQSATLTRMKKQGMKQYTFYGVTVWAQNEKNAKRKAYYEAFVKHIDITSQRNK